MGRINHLWWWMDGWEFWDFEGFWKGECWYGSRMGIEVLASLSTSISRVKCLCFGRVNRWYLILVDRCSGCCIYCASESRKIPWVSQQRVSWIRTSESSCLILVSKARDFKGYRWKNCGLCWDLLDQSGLRDEILKCADKRLKCADFELGDVSVSLVWFWLRVDRVSKLRLRFFLVELCYIDYIPSRLYWG
jgi:hypothetical protein